MLTKKVEPFVIGLDFEIDPRIDQWIVLPIWQPLTDPLIIWVGIELSGR